MNSYFLWMSSLGLILVLHTLYRNKRKREFENFFRDRE